MTSVVGMSYLLYDDDEELFADIPLPSEIVQAKITYPSAPAAVLSHQDNRLCVTFDRPNTAVFLEVRLG